MIDQSFPPPKSQLTPAERLVLVEERLSTTQMDLSDHKRSSNSRMDRLSQKIGQNASWVKELYDRTGQIWKIQTEVKSHRQQWTAELRTVRTEWAGEFKEVKHQQDEITQTLRDIRTSFRTIRGAINIAAGLCLAWLMLSGKLSAENAKLFASWIGLG